MQCEEPYHVWAPSVATSVKSPSASTSGIPRGNHPPEKTAPTCLGCTVRAHTAVNVGRADAKCAVNTTDVSIKCRDCQRGDSRRFGTFLTLAFTAPVPFTFTELTP